MSSFRGFLSLALLATACATTDTSENGANSSEEQLRSHPVSAAACASFDAKYPVTQQATLSSGESVGIPFRTCDTNSAGIFGTIDLSFAQNLLDGSGYVPLEVVHNGQPYAIMSLYVNEFLQSDFGSYKALYIQVASVPTGSTDHVKTLTWVNPMSAMIPAFDPNVSEYIYQIILTQDVSPLEVAYGRELLGADERVGDLAVVTDDTHEAFSVTDENGASVVQGVIHPDRRITTLLHSIVDLLTAVVAARLNPLEMNSKLDLLQLNQPIDDTWSLVARDAETNWQIKHSNIMMAHLPSFNVVTPQTLDFHIDTSSAVGQLLTDIHFTPVVLVGAQHASAVWTAVD
jgi:hypothetical protein